MLVPSKSPARENEKGGVEPGRTSFFGAIGTWKTHARPSNPRGWSSATSPEKRLGNWPHSRRSRTAPRPSYEIEPEDSLRRSAHRGNLSALITSPLASVIEKWQADCDSGAGHLLATIKPKIVRHTIILSTNNLFLLTPLTSPSGRAANPAVINLSIRSSRSLPIIFRVFYSMASSSSMHSLMILQHDRQ